MSASNLSGPYFHTAYVDDAQHANTITYVKSVESNTLAMRFGRNVNTDSITHLFCAEKII